MVSKRACITLIKLAGGSILGTVNSSFCFLDDMFRGMETQEERSQNLQTLLQPDSTGES
jgi:hypothetical protein